MAQHGDQQYRREVTQTDEHGNPVRKEYENVAQSDTGLQYECEVRHNIDEYGNPIHSATCGTTTQGLGQGNRGAGTGTHGAAGQQGLGTDYGSGGRSVGQTGYQGLGTERGSGGTAGFNQNQPSATPMGGAGIGTGTRDVYGGDRDGTGTAEKKGTMEKIKEKLPGHHNS
ncbi:hypothetical protein L1987_68498 [Smallanthus sonchifolius]|uniref:Uncharacterized protein n=1 Tax=Smallanthus sonchifolius TaxID=185202 RepID=A0ACB9B4X0_9ASTR|nr:hypothetical protein L1987_68498 [Smallanthus sonchifolius]